MRIYLHSDLAAAHAAHGASHDDHAQYAAYCTRRLSRLRHGKGVRRELLRCRMFKAAHSTRAEATEGKEGGGGSSKARHAYRAIDLANVPAEILASNPNYFWEPLYCAERCWAAAMAAKAEGNGMGGGSSSGGGVLGGGGNARKERTPGKLRAHSIKRLRKAAKFAGVLEALTTSKKAMPVENDDGEEGTANNGEVTPPVDEHTQMEAKAYASWMRGNLALEQNHWPTACAEYQAALTLCETLAQSTDAEGGEGKGSMQQLELLDFFTHRAQNVIAPLLRYCHYELQEKGMSPTEKISFLQSSSSVGEGDPLQSKLNTLKAETLQDQATSGSSSQIVFRENTIAVETKELRMALLKVQDLRTEWEEDAKGGSSGTANAGDAKFMALLNGYDDAIALANQERKQLAALKAGPAVNAKRFQLVNVLGYCKYQKLRLVMGRNEGMADGIVQRSQKKGMALKQFEEVAHLYDALLQDARAVAAIPGGGSPEDYDGETAAAVEDEFLLEAHANILRLRSLRCYYLARMHASPAVHKYPEALALLDQAESLAQEASEEIGACDQMEGADDMLEKLEGVLEEMRGEKCRVLAVAYLSKHRPSTSGKPLLERLHDYDIPSASTPLAHVPPRLEPMACKPSFFDVALNYVSEYPADELERALGEHREGTGAESKGGLLGWFRR